VARKRVEGTEGQTPPAATAGEDGNRIRVLIVDDHAAFRESLGYVFENQPDLHVVAEAGTLAEARDIRADADVALIDLSLPDGSGVEFIRELRSACPETAVVVLTAAEDSVILAEAVEAGAEGVLQKSLGIPEIIHAVRRIAGGEWLLSPAEVVQMFRDSDEQRTRDREGQRALERLTPREREVLEFLAEGLSDKEIAQRLGVSPDTARNHMVSILGKLGVESRLQALVFAVRHHAITIR
jgi:DNA-binding NarL/FixJ family response regulator